MSSLRMHSSEYKNNAVCEVVDLVTEYIRKLRFTKLLAFPPKKASLSSYLKAVVRYDTNSGRLSVVCVRKNLFKISVTATVK